MNSNISITVEQLNKNFGAVKALNSLSLSLDAGLLHGIIGPDGAGKTTLLRILSGLLHVAGGNVHYFENNRPVAFEDIRPSVGYMPSRASLYPDLSIEEHLLFFKNLYSLSDEQYQAKSEELLHITRLKEFSKRKVGQLSGGMYKKAGLMCALLQSPAVLLLDEPTNGVDPISRREFWELLHGLLKSGILIVIATAYMDEAERCSKVHLMDSGKIMKSGEPASILEASGAKDFNEVFMAASNKK